MKGGATAPPFDPRREARRPRPPFPGGLGLLWTPRRARSRPARPRPARWATPLFRAGPRKTVAIPSEQDILINISSMPRRRRAGAVKADPWRRYGSSSSQLRRRSSRDPCLRRTWPSRPRPSSTSPWAPTRPSSRPAWVRNSAPTPSFSASSPPPWRPASRACRSTGRAAR